MNKNLPEINKKYHIAFNGVEYDIKYLETNLMECTCTAADLEHHPSRINQAKIHEVNRFEIEPNIWCVYWKCSKMSSVQIEDWNKMSVNTIRTYPDLKVVRETGTITEK